MSTKKNTKKIIKIEVTKKTKPAKKPSKAPSTKKKKSAEKPAKETIEIAAPTEFIDMLTPKKPAKKTKAKKATKKPAAKKTSKKTSNKKKEDLVKEIQLKSMEVLTNKEAYKKPEVAANGNGFESCPNDKPTGCCCGQPTNASDITKQAVDAGNFIIKLIRKLFGKK